MLEHRSVPTTPAVGKQPQSKPFGLLPATCVAFVAGFCVMVLEIVAGRLMAPFVGTSLFTWTGIIGVILTGISIGNYFGGKIADRWGQRSTLAKLLVLSGAGSALILPSVEVADIVRKLDAPFAIQLTVMFASVFLLPSLLLGAIGPVVAKLALTDLRRSGDVIGKIYAATAAGSILGTFVTGFLLIAIMGTRLIVWCVASVLIAVGIIIALSQRATRSGLVVFAYGFLPIAALVVQKLELLTSPCLVESAHNCINVLPTGRDATKRMLVLDRLVHSFVDLNDRSYLGYSYQEVYAEVLKRNVRRDGLPSFLLIGGGGYTFARYLEDTYPTAQITVIELDPAVSEVASAFLGLPLDTRIFTHNDDARYWLRNLPRADRFDVIIGDATRDIAVPYHLTTREFDILVRRHLTEGGFYMTTVIDGATGNLLRAHVGTLKTVFPHIYFSPDDQETRAGPRVVVASAAPLALAPCCQKQRPGGFLSGDAVSRFLAEKPFVLLTDDYAPVDFLILPVLMYSQRQLQRPTPDAGYD